MRLRPAAPSLSIGTLLRYVIFFVACDSATLFLPRAIGLPVDMPEMETLRRPLGALIIFFAIGYALARAWFHPIYRANYRRWLEVSPWTPRQSLPLGPVRLTAADLLVLALLAAAGHWRCGLHPLVPPLAAAIAYLIAIVPPLCLTDRQVEVFAIIVAAPILFLTGENLWWTLLAAMALVLVAHWGLRRSFALFPWRAETPPPRADGLGWPFSRLAPVRPSIAVPRGAGALIGAILAWWIFAIAYRFGPPEPRSSILHWGLIAGLVCALGRAFAYLLGHASPLSLWGRVRTGRLIIPRYDIVFVAPLVTLVVCALVPLISVSTALSNELILALSLAAPVICALELGPSYLDWHTTGGHRIVPTSKQGVWGGSTR